MSVDIKSMFDSIKESLNNTKQNSGGNSSFRNLLKLEIGNTYLVRFIPNVSDPKNTFFHYFHHGWTSLSTGQYVDGLCLRTFGERCPICEARFKLYRTKSEEDRKLAYEIRQLEKHLVNVYVISDPTTTDNEGKVKILRFGKRIDDKVKAATDGDDAAEFGPKIFDLTENGCNFKIKVDTSSEGNRKFANYNNSRFTAPSAIPSMTAERIKEIHGNVFDLTKQVETKTAEELEQMLKDHFFVEKKTNFNTKGENASKTTTSESEKTVTSSKSTTAATGSKVDELLKQLDDLK